MIGLFNINIRSDLIDRISQKAYENYQILWDEAKIIDIVLHGVFADFLEKLMLRNKITGMKSSLSRIWKHLSHDHISQFFTMHMTLLTAICSGSNGSSNKLVNLLKIIYEL